MPFTDTLAGLIRAVPPGLAGAPTPCRDWDVRTLVNHLFQVGAAIELAGRGEPVPADHWRRSLYGFDFAALTPADPPETVSMGGTPMPGAVVADMLAADLVLHGWDLARATGQPFSCPPELAERALGFVDRMGGPARGMGLFAEPVPVPADAPALTRAVGLSGRDPAWQPATV
jgi:uncharacterized protein (TIGR03086 family)